MALHQAHTSKGNILVVDDTPDNVRLLAAMLTHEGYEVRKALNGRMAITACNSVLPDLILLDINMPEMNGYEVCQQLKADRQTQEVPVIFISALDDVLDKVKAFNIGGVDFISKPFQGAEVISRVENQLNLRGLQVKLQQKNILLEQTLAELKSIQVQLIQKEKMFALGQMVAGIAHEINNPISFIYGNLKYASEYVQELVNIIQIYQQEYPQPSRYIQQKVTDIDLDFVVNDVQNLLGAMYRGTERIQQIVYALQNFSRLEESLIKEVNIHTGIESNLLMLEHRLRSTITRPAINVVKNFGDLPLIMCYASELNQVFMHILNNAIDALDSPEANSETIHNPQIHICTEEIAPNRVKVSIIDNGPGIPESVKERVFDPFFTTKPIGKGTGLGLAISYQIIVQKHQGKLSFNSALGQGTEVDIEIPIHQPNLN